jgi:hypothetical protein
MRALSILTLVGAVFGALIAFFTYESDSWASCPR